VKKLPETFTETNVKQEKECTEKVVLTKRQLEAKEDKLTDIRVLNKLCVCLHHQSLSITGILQLCDIEWIPNLKFYL
jgi:hypothetical protein